MKETYTKPEAKLDEFETVDVLTASGEGYEDNSSEYGL